MCAIDMTHFVELAWAKVAFWFLCTISILFIFWGNCKNIFSQHEFESGKPFFPKPSVFNLAFKPGGSGVFIQWQLTWKFAKKIFDGSTSL